MVPHPTDHLIRWRHRDQNEREALETRHREVYDRLTENFSDQDFKDLQYLVDEAYQVAHDQAESDFNEMS